MHKSTVEEKAITHLKDSLLNCPRLHPYLSVNDKTPSWDGEVFLYDDSSKKKDKLRACLP